MAIVTVCSAPARRLAALLLAVCSCAVLGRNGPPNIVVILADDLGAETVGAYGGESYDTPRLDRMAREGVRFEHAHAQPLCTPSRIKLMTGQYNFRNYRHFGYLDPNETTFAHILGGAGYHTAVIGKWQLHDNRFQELDGAFPGDAGFDEYVLWQLRADQRGSRYWAPLIDHDGEVRQYGADVFGPDVLNNAVLAYFEAQRDRPFFLYYPMVLPHSPWVTTPAMRDEAADDQQRFAAMLAYTDTLVGRVLDKLQVLDIAEHTLVLFLGDNGTGRDIRSRYRGTEVRGGKGLTLHSGTRVPFIAWGAGVEDGGRASDSLVDFNDVLPTVAALAGVELPAGHPQDGSSLLSVLRGEGELPRQSLFVHYEPRWPVGRPARYAFDRRWKLYQDGRFYDLLEDPLEQRPLSLSGLDKTAFVAYRSLEARIAEMPGELEQGGRWLPPLPVVLVVMALLFVGVIFRAGFRLLGKLNNERIR